MSKHIPKPIITIGFSTNKKNSGKLTFEINDTKIKNMKDDMFIDLLMVLKDVDEKIKQNNNQIYNVLPTKVYELVKNHIRSGKLLSAVKTYKEITGLGLKDSKIAVEKIKIKLNNP